MRWLKTVLFNGLCLFCCCCCFQNASSQVCFSFFSFLFSMQHSSVGQSPGLCCTTRLTTNFTRVTCQQRALCQGMNAGNVVTSTGQHLALPRFTPTTRKGAVVSATQRLRSLLMSLRWRQNSVYAVRLLKLKSAKFSYQFQLKSPQTTGQLQKSHDPITTFALAEAQGTDVSAEFYCGTRNWVRQLVG